jgi:hypothetical protein
VFCNLEPSPVTLFNPVSSIAILVFGVMLAFEFFINVLNPLLPAAYNVPVMPRLVARTFAYT